MRGCAFSTLGSWDRRWYQSKSMKLSRRRRSKSSKQMPVVGVEKLQNILEICEVGREAREAAITHLEGGEPVGGVSIASDHCPDCDETFFPLLLKEVKEVVSCFTKGARRLFALHSHSGFHKYVFWAKRNLHHANDSLTKRCYDLMHYGIENSMEMRNVLKRYDKVHSSKKGHAFQSRLQIFHLDILQSPWLCELIALYINTQNSDCNTEAFQALLNGCSLSVYDGKPMLSCRLFDSLMLNIDLTCSICLDTAFDVVSLSCGHIFCYMCACDAASVSIVDGLKSADPRSKCPLCRQVGVYEGTMRLNELNTLLSQSCTEYWGLRLQRERVERVQKVKLHWQSQCQAFMGF